MTNERLPSIQETHPDLLPQLLVLERGNPLTLIKRDSEQITQALKDPSQILGFDMLQERTGLTATQLAEARKWSSQFPPQNQELYLGSPTYRTKAGEFPQVRELFPTPDGNPIDLSAIAAFCMHTRFHGKYPVVCSNISPFRSMTQVPHNNHAAVIKQYPELETVSDTKSVQFVRRLQSVDKAMMSLLVYELLRHHPSSMGVEQLIESLKSQEFSDPDWQFIKQLRSYIYRVLSAPITEMLIGQQIIDYNTVEQMNINAINWLKLLDNYEMENHPLQITRAMYQHWYPSKQYIHDYELIPNLHFAVQLLRSYMQHDYYAPLFTDDVTRFTPEMVSIISPCIFHYAVGGDKDQLNILLPLVTAQNHGQRNNLLIEIINKKLRTSLPTQWVDEAEQHIKAFKTPGRIDITVPPRREHTDVTKRREILIEFLK